MKYVILLWKLVFIGFWPQIWLREWFWRIFNGYIWFPQWIQKGKNLQCFKFFKGSGGREFFRGFLQINTQLGESNYYYYVNIFCCYQSSEQSITCNTRWAIILTEVESNTVDSYCSKIRITEKKKSNNKEEYII